MVPAHGSSFETPTRHHTRRRGRPFPRRLLLGWSERVRIRQRLRARICAGSGRTPGATPKKQRRHHARTRCGFFGNPRLFCAPTSTSKEEPGRCAAAKLLHPRRGPGLAVNIVKLPEPPAQAVTQKLPAASSGPARGILAETGEAGDVLSLAMCDYRSGAGHRRARWTSASKPSWPTFSPSRVKNRTRCTRGCASPSPTARRSSERKRRTSA